MSVTARLTLPLLQAAQAQKHVTVNESLGLLDGLCQMTLAGIGATTPPALPAEGELWALGDAPDGDWTGQAGRLALYLNGGWVFVTPQPGWRGWLAPAGGVAIHDGAGWQAGAVAVSPNGAATVAEVIEVDLTLDPGPATDTAPLIPAGSVVQAVTGRVLGDITGTAASWRLGVAGSDDRYGTGYGLSAGSWALGLTGQPQAYYADTALRVTAESGGFSGGTVRLCVHLSRFTLPRG